jgi:hypothetical protein
LEKIHPISSNSWAKHGQKNEFEFNAAAPKAELNLVRSNWYYLSRSRTKR